MRDRAACWLRVLALACGLTLAFAPPSTFANGTPATDAADPEIEARMRALAAELRCLVCQNQTVADSHAGLAEDLRRQLRELLAKGLSDAQVRAYMTDRYGDFVLYRPPFKASTVVLWLGPALLMFITLGGLLAVLRRRRRMAADAFDPDIAEEDHNDGTHR